MKVYILRSNRSPAIQATYMCNDDVSPSSLLEVKLANQGYTLTLLEPEYITSEERFEEKVRDEVCSMNDMVPEEF